MQTQCRREPKWHDVSVENRGVAWGQASPTGARIHRYGAKMPQPKRGRNTAPTSVSMRWSKERDAGGWEKEENVGNSLVMGLTVHSRGSWGQVPKTCVFGMITKSPFGWGKFTGRGQCRAGQGQLSKTRVSWKGGWCTSHTRWCLRPCPRPHSVRSFLWTVPASFNLGVFRLNSNI